MSKPMLVTVPFLFFLLDYWPLKRFPPAAPNKLRHQGTTQARASIRTILWEKLPVLLVSFASCAATILAQRHFIVPICHLSLMARGDTALLATIVDLRQRVW